MVRMMMMITMMQLFLQGWMTRQEEPRRCYSSSHCSPCKVNKRRANEGSGWLFIWQHHVQTAQDCKQSQRTQQQQQQVGKANREEGKYLSGKKRETDLFYVSCKHTLELISSPGLKWQLWNDSWNDGSESKVNSSFSGNLTAVFLETVITFIDHDHEEKCFAVFVSISTLSFSTGWVSFKFSWCCRHLKLSDPAK